MTAARVYDGAGAPAVVPPGAYSVDAASQPGRIILSPNFPPAGRAYAGIEFDILAGFGASAAQTPAPLRQAILLLIARWFENRGDAGMPGGAMPDDIRGLIQAFRRRRI